VLFFDVCLLYFSGFTLAMSSNHREGGTIHWIHAPPSLIDRRSTLHVVEFVFFKLA
jgi:hypothetical protein